MSVRPSHRLTAHGRRLAITVHNANGFAVSGTLTVTVPAHTSHGKRVRGLRLVRRGVTVAVGRTRHVVFTLTRAQRRLLARGGKVRGGKVRVTAKLRIRAGGSGSTRTVRQSATLRTAR